MIRKWWPHPPSFSHVIGFLLLLLALAWTSSANFLLFHVLVEGLAILVALIMFTTAWNSHVFSRNPFLLYLSSGYFWVAVIDAVHTLSYEGMGVLALRDAANVATQLWLAARYSETFLLLSALFFLRRDIGRVAAFWQAGLFPGAALILVASGRFPDAFIPELGLTPFKVGSEYLIIALLGLALWAYWSQRQAVDRGVLLLSMAAIATTMAAELFFTLYVSVYGLSNIFGHFLKLVSFWFLFQAVILTSIKTPFRALSRSANSFDAIPYPVLLVDREGRIRQANRAAIALAGRPLAQLLGQPSHDPFHPGWPPHACPICRGIGAGDGLAPREVQDGVGRWWVMGLEPVAIEGDVKGGVLTCQEVTQRKRLELDLEAQKRRLDFVMDGSAAGFWEWPDVNAQRVWWSPLTYRLLGVAEGDVEPSLDALSARIHPADRERFQQALDDHLQQRAPFDVELRVVHGDGRILWVHARGGAEWDAAGRPLRMGGIVRDITLLKETLQAVVEKDTQLMAGNARLRALLDSVGDGVFELDAQGRCTFINPTACRMLGRSREESLGLTFHTLVHSAYKGWNPHPPDRCPIRQTAIDGVSRASDDDVFWHKDGTRLPVSYTSAPLVRAGRVEGVVITCKDITQRKADEKRLRESEQFNRMVIENIAEGLVVLDAQGCHRIWNAAMERITGVGAAEVLGRRPQDCFSFVCEQGIDHDIRQAFQGISTQREEVPMALPAKPEGWFSLKHVPLRDKGGVVTGVIAVVHDITRRKQAELAREEMHRQALHSARLATLGTLSAGIAHEINNPNNAIAVNTSLLRQAWEEAMPILDSYHREYGDFSLGGLPYSDMREEMARLFVSLGENSRRIQAIIDNMKHLARGGEGHAFQALNLDDIIRNTAQILRGQIRKRTNRFQLELHGALPAVRGNLRQLEQVLINLILNALQALPDAERGVTVGSEYDATRQHVQVTIRDEGVGIPPHHLERLGEPFFTSRQEEGGMGLGLSISRTILERHGGDMAFASTPGKGATVTLTFPAAAIRGE